ncbi:DUF6122 family protein [Yeosuana sp. MJ-SS3]|uniref:DUF6122 family protein n=1 Tax=Gilvirhabdus luticola TaxID=3079858 RepID=A0ABU3U814_9FLAO|nr:DUF6122 family protein [Yeosuana sp. MJ-SS3]MDU8886555.1 DUF6122 family protein [Yeosuana sp. MJ-SS3]
MIQQGVHYGIHFIIPLVVALIFFKSTWKMAYLIMISTMLIDLDHLFANPIFDANRCSINFHPLHSYFAIVLYVLLLLPKSTRIIGLGLMIHILADSMDCLFM